jgi:hypothetical protein
LWFETQHTSLIQPSKCKVCVFYIFINHWSHCSN